MKCNWCPEEAKHLDVEVSFIYPDIRKVSNSKLNLCNNDLKELEKILFKDATVIEQAP